MATDNSIFGNDGTLFGDAYMQDGRIFFDGDGDYVIIGAPASLRFYTSDFRIECDFATTADGSLVNRWNADDGTISLGITNGTMHVQVDNTGPGDFEFHGSTVVNDGQLHHTVLSRVGQRICLTVDSNTDLDTVLTYLESTDAYTDWWVGAFYNPQYGISEFYTGSISDVKIWSVPYVPQLVIQVEDQSGRLMWPPHPCADTYDIEAADDPDGPFTIVSATTDTTVIDPLGVNTRRFYHIVPRN